jgi:hypothetical protein
MKTQDKSPKQNSSDSSHKKQNPGLSSKKAEVNMGGAISTNSSNEDPTKPKRLGESETEITDETTI